jgi:hypothetical protein
MGQMVVQAEEGRAALRVPTANALENAGAVMQSGREKMDGGVLKGNQLTVKPDKLGFHQATTRAFALPGFFVAGEGAFGPAGFVRHKLLFCREWREFSLRIFVKSRAIRSYHS